MTLTNILVFTAALLAAPVLKQRGRGWFLFLASLAAVYWMQPSTPIRNLDFWLPTASIALTAWVWATTRLPAEQNNRQDAISAAIIGGVILALGFTRYLGPLCCLTPTPPPQIPQVLLAVIALGVSGALAARILAGRGWALQVFFVSIVGIFIVLKYEPLAQSASAVLRGLSGQSPGLATALDIRWLGFSYMALRLLHAIRDRLAGKLPGLSLQEFVTYSLFFPAFTSGPIDRAERFVQDLRADFSLSADALLKGGQRLVLGLFKKFALADGLALFALNSVNAVQTDSTLWMWVLLYAYSFRLYFDFSGYTDVALGLGILAGVQLPENFERPYRKPNLTAFWNSWHMSLAQWFRAYLFNPLTRSLRSGARKLPVWLIVLIGQLATMTVIGAWHGIALNYILWGLWHGLGLFIHNRWADFAKTRAFPLPPRLANLLGGVLTFHFVALGWVWFAAPELTTWPYVFKVLFGIL